MVQHMKMLRPNGARIAELRRHKGLGQADCKIDAKTLRKIERGEPARFQQLKRLAEALGVSPEAIVHSDEVAAVRELDAIRLAWRKINSDEDLIRPDQHVQSKRAEQKSLEPIDESRFVNAIRAAEILKWHVDLVHPSVDKLQYLEKVGELVDYFRQYVKGVGGYDTLVARGSFEEERKESDFLFRKALEVEKKSIKLRELIGIAQSYRIKFFWVGYTFWWEDVDIKREPFFSEQRVTLVVASDTDREKISAVVHTGLCPYEEGQKYLDELKQSTADLRPVDGAVDDKNNMPAGQEVAPGKARTKRRGEEPM
jgi:transcriptional regulator with XRE-family HTH domain